MTPTQISLYIGLLGLLIFGIASFVEYYKKTIRKNKSKTWENRIIGFILSVFATFILGKIRILVPILGNLGAPFWADIVFYIIGFYLLQKYADMKLIKSLIRNCSINFLKSKGLSETQIKEILEACKNSKTSEEE